MDGPATARQVEVSGITMVVDESNQVAVKGIKGITVEAPAGQQAPPDLGYAAPTVTSFPVADHSYKADPVEITGIGGMVKNIGERRTATVAANQAKLAAQATAQKAAQAAKPAAPAPAPAASKKSHHKQAAPAAATPAAKSQEMGNRRSSGSHSPGPVRSWIRTPHL